MSSEKQKQDNRRSEALRRYTHHFASIQKQQAAISSLAGVTGVAAAFRLTPQWPFRITLGAAAYVGAQFMQEKLEESKYVTEEAR